MIAQLNGTVLELNANMAVIDVHGVGYEVLCSAALRQRLEVGESAKVIVFTDVKEDSIKLYGFVDEFERRVFGLLLQVQGIGARSASELLSNVDKRDLLRFIGSGSIVELQRVKGIGKKTAERLIVELKDKVAKYTNDTLASRVEYERYGVSDMAGEAVQALVALGFVRRDAEGAVERAKAQSAQFSDAGDLVREALRHV